MRRYDLKKEADNAQLIAVISLVFSVFAVILTLYAVLNVNTALQGFARSSFGNILNPEENDQGNQEQHPTSVPFGTKSPTPQTIGNILNPDENDQGNQEQHPTRIPFGTRPPIPQTSGIPPIPSESPAPLTGYSLNLIGIPKGKSADMTGNAETNIFISLANTCQLKVIESAFAVTDGNCADGNAQIQLPKLTGSVLTDYTVWVQAQAKPGGESSATPCQTDSSSGNLYCFSNTRVSGKPRWFYFFSRYHWDPLYVNADLNADGKLERVPLFDSRLKDIYWHYDNQGLKIARLRLSQRSLNLHQRENEQ